MGLSCYGLSLILTLPHAAHFSSNLEFYLSAHGLLKGISSRISLSQPCYVTLSSKHCSKGFANLV